MTVNPNPKPNPFNPNDLNAKKVQQFHTKDDVDSAYSAHHHTLGTAVNQAASGYDMKIALEGIDSNLETIQQLITDLQETQADLVEQTAILDKVGKRWERLSATTSSIPNAASAPYTALTGFDTHEGDTFEEVGCSYSGGAVTALEDGSFNFEVAQNWAANANNRRVIFVNLNSTATGGNSYYRFTVSPVNSAAYLQFHKFDMRLAAGDVVRFATFQDSGGALARTTADGIQRPSGSYSLMLGVTRILGQ